MVWRNKYGAVKTEIDGIIFASRAESRRYLELKLLREQGRITDLVLQPKYPMFVEGIKICTYIADFSYMSRDEKGRWKPRVEDVKGVQTAVFKLKKKLFEALYPQLVLEIIE